MSATLMSAIAHLKTALDAVPKKRKKATKTKAKPRKTLIRKAPARKKNLGIAKAKPSPAKRVVRKKNPLSKYIVFVGPQFDTLLAAREFAQNFANQHKLPVHVYKA